MNEPTWMAAVERERLRKQLTFVILGAVVASSLLGGGKGYAAYVTLAERADSVAQAALDSADIHHREAARLEAEVHRLHSLNAGLRDEMAAANQQYAADSARWEEEEREHEAVIALADSVASDAAAELTEALDESQTVLFAAYVEAVDTRLAATEAERELLEERLASANRRLDLSERLRVGLDAELDVVNRQLVALTAENLELTNAVSSLRAANEGLREALESQGRQNTLLKVGGGVVALALVAGAVR